MKKIISTCFFMLLAHYTYNSYRDERVFNLPRPSTQENPRETTVRDTIVEVTYESLTHVPYCCEICHITDHELVVHGRFFTDDELAEIRPLLKHEFEISSASLFFFKNILRQEQNPEVRAIIQERIDQEKQRFLEVLHFTIRRKIFPNGIRTANNTRLKRIHEMHIGRRPYE